MAPHLDLADIVTREYAAEQSAAARDRYENERRIREQLREGAGVAGKLKSVHCGICGSPFGDRQEPRNSCTDCRREAKQVPPGLRDKMSPEELYDEDHGASPA